MSRVVWHQTKKVEFRAPISIQLFSIELIGVATYSLTLLRFEEGHKLRKPKYITRQAIIVVS